MFKLGSPQGCPCLQIMIKKCLLLKKYPEQILNYEIYFSPMHSPMKNQQAISVTTTAFTATSFMDAWAHLKVRASLVRLPTPLTMPPTSAEGTSSTLARAANLVTSLRTNLSQARAAFIRAMTLSLVEVNQAIKA